jgi:hypothetical protein
MDWGHTLMDIGYMALVFIIGFNLGSRKKSGRCANTSTNSSSTKLADDVECAKQWLLPQRPVTQVEVDACIGELDIIVSQLRAS